MKLLFQNHIASIANVSISKLKLLRWSGKSLYGKSGRMVNKDKKYAVIPSFIYN
mgnify:CR=1 FL=1